MNRQFSRKLKGMFSTGATRTESGNSAKFIFKKTQIKKSEEVVENRIKSKSMTNSWNNKTFFLVAAISSILIYSIAQLGIGVYLDGKSRELQALREEESYLIEENKNLESKVAKHMSKIRVEITAEEELKMKRSSDAELVKVTSGTISAGLID